MRRKVSKYKLYIAGDSTASNYDQDRAPRAGWGQVIDRFFNDNIKVINKAASGRSSKSYYEEGRLDEILDEISNGDYLFIQFGHNDQKDGKKRHTSPFDTYQSYLSKYIEGARKNSAIPVLITPVSRRNFDEKKLLDTHGSYPQSMMKLAEELDVPLINITHKSKILFENLGLEKTKDIFLWLEAGEHTNYPEGVEDNTHFCESGAIQIAELIVEGIRELGLELKNYINKALS